MLEGIVTCEIVLTNMCDAGNVHICLTSKGNSTGSDTVMDWSLWCR